MSRPHLQGLSTHVPRFTIEYLASVPGEVRGPRVPLGLLRLPHGFSVVPFERFEEPVGPGGPVGDEYNPAWADRERAEVEPLVVHGTEDQPVVLGVGTPAWCQRTYAASRATDTATDCRRLDLGTLGSSTPSQATITAASTQKRRNGFSVLGIMLTVSAGVFRLARRWPRTPRRGPTGWGRVLEADA
jgi:hypothetical protein